MIMDDKNAKDELLVKLYKSAAALRRAERKEQLKNCQASAATPEMKPGNVVVVRIAKNAKPMSTMGGVSKVLGPSRIRIPEFKLHRS